MFNGKKIDLKKKKKKYIYIYICRDTIRSPSPKDLEYKPNESKTMNLYKVGERVWLLANGLIDNKDLKNEQTQKNTNKA